MNRTISIPYPNKNGAIEIGSDHRLVLIAGPCQIESRDHARMMAEAIREICAEHDVPVIFKASYDKANRTSLAGARGVGIDKGLDILGEIRRDMNMPVITDVHESHQVGRAAAVVDVLQTPAFLCRQTDFMVDVARSGLPINVKKGQFLAPWDMQNVLNKMASTGNQNLMPCERGASFGYNNLVVDMTGLPVMAETGYPVVFDATHSVQRPGGNGTSTGGNREFVPPLARAAVATGSVSAVFIETHNDPDNAPSDGPNSVRLENFSELVRSLKGVHREVKPGAYSHT